MFNTFGTDTNDFLINKQNPIHPQQRNIQLNNLSTIQLNPWNDQNSKSPLYLESQGFPSFPKPTLKTNQIIKYSIPRQAAKKAQEKNIIDRKRFDVKNSTIKQNFLSRRRMRITLQSNDLNKMNKTISVHNFESKMLGQNQSINFRQRRLSKQQKRQRTTINNPMYNKFCNNYQTQKTNLSKKRKSSDFQSIKFDSLSMQQIYDYGSKISVFSITKGDPERVKNIHQIRKRLKSTAQIMRQKQEYYENKDNQFSQRVNQHSQDKMNKNSPQVKRQKSVKIHQGKGSCFSQNIQQTPIKSQQSQKYKLGRRKNLYIGYRKFFNPTSHIKQRTISRKQSISRQVVNLNALMQNGQGNIIKKFQTLQQFAYQKSYKHNN